jgi:hypothetical protein
MKAVSGLKDAIDEDVLSVLPSDMSAPRSEEPPAVTSKLPVGLQAGKAQNSLRSE